MLHTFHSREDAWRKLTILLSGLALFALFVAPPLVSNIFPRGQANNWDGKAWIPEPRHDMPGWSATHEKYVQETRIAVQAGKPLDLLFMGDSITEAWLGLDRGHECFDDRCNQIPRVWDENFCHLNAMAFGIGGDRTEHMLWRLQNGEGQDLHPRVIVLLIGTNNLGWAAKKSDDYLSKIGDDTVLGIVTVVLQLRKMMPSSKIVVLGNLPRGERSWDRPDNKERYIQYAQPSIYTPVLNQVNVQVNRWLSQAKEHDPSHGTYFLDCSSVFLLEDGSISESLMPDALHPSAPGYERMLSECLWPSLTKLHSVSQRPPGACAAKEM
eukprot:484438-Prorocentrum_minimum.AAC.4